MELSLVYFGNQFNRQRLFVRTSCGVVEVVPGWDWLGLRKNGDGREWVALLVSADYVVVEPMDQQRHQMAFSEESMR